MTLKYGGWYPFTDYAIASPKTFWSFLTSSIKSKKSAVSLLILLKIDLFFNLKIDLFKKDEIFIFFFCLEMYPGNHIK